MNRLKRCWSRRPGNLISLHSNCPPAASVDQRWERRESCLKSWGSSHFPSHLLFFVKKFLKWIWKTLHQPGSTHVLGDRNGRYTHTVGYSRWRWSSSSRITIITSIISVSTINYNHLSGQWSNVGPWPGGPPCHSRRSSCPSRLCAQVVTKARDEGK